MKIIITESQLNFISEIEKSAGRYHTLPLSSLFDYLDGELTKKDKLKSFEEYFKKTLGFKKRDVKDYEENVLEFFGSSLFNNFDENFNSKDSRSGFAFYIIKNYFGLKKGIGLDYFIENDYENKTFHFFDPQLEIYVGKISLTPKNYGKKYYKVTISATDEQLIGKGYGTKMYLTVIDNVNYLASDTTLFTGSYRMWKNILPKYVNVWGVKSDFIFDSYEKIRADKKQSVRKYNYFVASKNNKPPFF